MLSPTCAGPGPARPGLCVALRCVVERGGVGALQCTQATFRGHRLAVYCCTYDRSGGRIITGSDDWLVKVRVRAHA